MAIFSKKQNTAGAAETPKEVKPVAKKGTQISSRDLSHALVSPRVTEKATDLQSLHNAYVFDISASATKNDIAQAVRQMYKITPLKIRVVTVRSKTKRNARTGKTGVQSGGRKAYVFLKKGDSITIS